MPPAIEDALSEAGRIAAAHARLDWWIIGSAAAALHGVDVGPIGDIDLLTDRADAARILRAKGVQPDRDADIRRFRSYYGRWNSEEIVIEVMGGLEVCEPAGWRPVWPTSRHLVELGDVSLYVPDRAELAAIMRRFGRPKDLLRASPTPRWRIRYLPFAVCLPCALLTIET